jgi:hypothetical protein
MNRHQCYWNASGSAKTTGKASKTNVDITPDEQGGKELVKAGATAADAGEVLRTTD